MGGIIHFRFLTLIYLSSLPFHSFAVGPSQPSPSEPVPAAEPAPMPSPESMESQNNAPVNMNICNGDMTINNYHNCVFYGSPPEAGGAHPPPAGYIEREGRGGSPGGDNVVTVTEYVTETKTVYAKGPAPATPEPETKNGQAKAGVADGSPDSIPDSIPEPSGSNLEPDSQPDSMPEGDNDANVDAEPEPIADTDTDPDANPSSLDPLDADDQYASKKVAFDEAKAFAGEFVDEDSKYIARKIHLYWNELRGRLCRVCITIVDKIGREISEEQQRELSEAFGPDAKYFDIVKEKLDEIYSLSYEDEGKIPEPKWGEECTNVIREYIFQRAPRNRGAMQSLIRTANRNGQAKEAEHHTKRLRANDIYFERIRTGVYDMSCKKDSQLEKVFAMWEELDKKQSVFTFGGLEDDEKEELDQVNRNGEDDDEEREEEEEEIDDDRPSRADYDDAWK